MRGEQGREGLNGLRASSCLRVGKRLLGGNSRVTVADLVRWGDWRGFSPSAAPSVLGLSPYRGGLPHQESMPRYVTQSLWVQIPASPLTGWESLGKVFNLCALQITQSTSLLRWVQGVNERKHGNCLPHRMHLESCHCSTMYLTHRLSVPQQAQEGGPIGPIW